MILGALKGPARARKIGALKKIEPAPRRGRLRSEGAKPPCAADPKKPPKAADFSKKNKIRDHHTMTLEEIFDIETHNQSEIHLFRQGMFYRAFERSCVALRSIERYAVLKKRSATTGIEYIYSGFPVSVLDRVAAGRGMTQVSDDHVILSGHPVSDLELDRLKQTTPTVVYAEKQKTKTEPQRTPSAKPQIELDFVTNHTQPTTPKSSDMEPSALLDLVRRFDLNGATPAMCKLFLTMIKTQL